jgi:hypothetical protein
VHLRTEPHARIASPRMSKKIILDPNITYHTAYCSDHTGKNGIFHKHSRWKLEYKAANSWCREITWCDDKRAGNKWAAEGEEEKPSMEGSRKNPRSSSWGREKSDWCGQHSALTSEEHQNPFLFNHQAIGKDGRAPALSLQVNGSIPALSARSHVPSFLHFAHFYGKNYV